MGEEQMSLRNLLFVSTAIAVGLPGAAWAQPEPAPAQPADPTGAIQTPAPEAEAQPQRAGVEDIVVTARRTEERLQDVPVAVSAFNEQTMTNLGIENFGDVGKAVPNLDTQRQFGSASAPQFFLRGIASGLLSFEVDSPIGLYVDGVYLGRPAGTAFDLADVSRVEVLRGPQGTLFGRNSVGGAINFITSVPKGEFGVRAEATVGNYDRMRGRITVDLPALGPLAARVTYMHDENKGYVRNRTPGRTFTFSAPFGTVRSASSFGAEETDAFAAAVRLDLGRFTADYKFDFTDKVSSQLGTQLLGFGTPPSGTAAAAYSNPNSIVIGPSTRRRDSLALDFMSPSDLEIRGHSLTAAYEFSDQITLKSITGRRKLDEFVGGNDIDGGALIDPATGLPFTPISAIQDRNQSQWTQEVQLIGKMTGFDWILGAFYFDEKGRDNNPVFLDRTFTPGLNTVTPGDYLIGANATIHNKSYAGYAHATAYIGERIELAGGARYTKDERREFVINSGLIGLVLPSQAFKAKFDHWDFDATATYKFNNDVRTYARFATGYLSGGILHAVEFKPETAKSYELGLKGDFLDKKLRNRTSSA
jgi:iron complex outermembrane recepter protein